MSPLEVDNLIGVIHHNNYPDEDHIKAYLLLSELQYITNRIARARWDRTMSYLAQDEICMQVVRPVHEDHPLWYTDHVPLPEGALFYVTQHSTAGSGVNTSKSMLDLRQVL